ncbi:MAG: methylated-DNA--[protein]-cysteine S-methyltransferase [Bacillus sp. (in: firmicutes)]
MKRLFFYDTNIGKIGIAENGTGITDVYMADSIEEEVEFIQETPLLIEAAKQLNEYLAGQRITFDLPLASKGTEFQQKVWNVLKTIPYGETWSYKQVAEAIGQPTASRAVGMANNKNPIMIIVPCHRVIGSNKKLVGYAGGLEMKEKLLKLEEGHVKQ